MLKQLQKVRNETILYENKDIPYGVLKEKWHMLENTAGKSYSLNNRNVSHWYLGTWLQYRNISIALEKEEKKRQINEEKTKVKILTKSERQTVRFICANEVLYIIPNFTHKHKAHILHFTLQSYCSNVSCIALHHNCQSTEPLM
jgi:hypothetical protein